MSIAQDPPAVYFASKIKHADVLKQAREQWSEICITSRWLDMADQESILTPEGFSQAWQIDEKDVCNADFVVVYANETDVLRGALVEVGMGIVAGLEIVLVGNCPSYGTWQHHPLCTRVRDLDQARAYVGKAWVRFWSK